MQRRTFNPKVDFTKPLEQDKWMMDLNLMLDDIVGFCDFMQHLPTYANNAAAVTGGLLLGQMYKTSIGEVRVVV